MIVADDNSKIRMGDASMENAVKTSKKQRLKWWHVIVVGLLAFAFFVCSIILFFVWNVSNIGSIEVVSFTQQENALVGEFYNIPDELDVMFLKHRQYSGGGFLATYSQAYFYLDKNDVQNFWLWEPSRSMLRGKKNQE